MIAPLILALLASSRFELGGAGGIGRIMGGPVVATGRDASVVDPLRMLWSGSGWVGYQWMRGHVLAIRYDHSVGSANLDHQQDLGEDLQETLTLDVYGMEYVRSMTHARYRFRVGGGLGYAKVTDELETASASLSAKGTGFALWLRSGIEVPLVSDLRWNLDGVGQWTSFAAMKTEALEPYKTDFPVLRLETGLSLGF